MLAIPLSVTRWLDEQYIQARKQFDALPESEMIEAIREHMAKAYLVAAKMTNGPA